MGFLGRLFGGGDKKNTTSSELTNLQIAHHELGLAVDILRDQVIGEDALDRTVVPQDKMVVSGSTFRAVADKLLKVQVNLGACAGQESVAALRAELLALRERFTAPRNRCLANVDFGQQFKSSIESGKGDALLYYRTEIGKVLAHFGSSELLDTLEALLDGLEMMSKRVKVHLGLDKGVELPERKEAA